MDVYEIKELIKDSLDIRVEQSAGLYGEKHTEVILLFDGEVISSSTLDVDL